MFSRHGEHVWSAQSGHHLLGLIELRAGSHMSEIAGMDYEIGGVAQIVDLIDRMTERIDHVRVGGAGESEVAVTDLGEAQRGRAGAAAAAEPATCEITSPPVTVSATAAPNQAVCRISSRRDMLLGSCSPSSHHHRRFHERVNPAHVRVGTGLGELM